jgi:hypothetical protein
MIFGRKEVLYLIPPPSSPTPSRRHKAFPSFIAILWELKPAFGVGLKSAQSRVVQAPKNVYLKT